LGLRNLAPSYQIKTEPQGVVTLSIHAVPTSLAGEIQPAGLLARCRFPQIWGKLKIQPSAGQPKFRSSSILKAVTCGQNGLNRQNAFAALIVSILSIGGCFFVTDARSV